MSTLASESHDGNGASCHRAFYSQHLRDIRWVSGGEGSAKCPFHDDRTASFSVNAYTGLWFCHACNVGGTARTFAERLGLEAPPASSKQSAESVFDYCDESGALLYQVVRFVGKKFRQRHPDGLGGWIWNLNGVRRVPYRLPELLKGTGNVFIVEGEKDVESLRNRGFDATCNSGGAGKWRDEYGEALEGRACVLIADNDEPGRAHIEDVARKLTLYAAKLINLGVLPGLPEHGDVTDWFAAGHTAAELLELVQKVATQAGGRLDLAAAVVEDDAAERARQLKAAKEQIAEIDKTLAADISQAYSVAYLSCAAVISEQDPQCFERLKTNLKARGVSLSSWQGRVKEIVQKRAAEAKVIKDAAKAAAKAAPPTHPSTSFRPVGIYRETEHGLVRVQVVKEQEVEIPLTNFTARITSDITHDDGAETTRAFGIEVRLGESSATFTVPAIQFAGMHWPTQHLGPQAVVHAGQGTADHTRVAIQLMLGRPARRVIYAHTGWRKIGEAWVYLHAGGAIGATGAVEGVEVSLPPELGAFKLELPSTRTP